VKKNIDYWCGKRQLGEIDILAWKPPMELTSDMRLYEIKTDPKYIGHGCDQLNRAEKWLDFKCEKYLVCEDVIYYVENNKRLRKKR